MASSLYKANLTKLLPQAAASNNATNVTAVSTEIFSISAYNAAASVRYVKIYDKASSPTVGTDVPVIVLAIGPGVSGQLNWAKGYYLTNGLSYGIVTGAANSDNTSITANDVVALTITYSL